MSYSDSKKIKIPESHYVGFNNRGGNVPLGFMTPDGTDSAANNRKSTVDRWSNKDIPKQTFKNIPMSGFNLGKNISYGSGWNSRHDKWRIQDPRGFELEIHAGNLHEIIKNCTIENGEIIDQCVWGRLGPDNVLIPASSEIYKNATENTKRLNSSVKMNEIAIGDKITLANGEIGIYLGKVFFFGFDADNKNYYGYPETFKCLNPDDKVIAILYLNNKDNTKYSSVGIHRSIKVSYVEKSTNVNTDELITMVNKLITEKSISISVNLTKYSYHIRVKLLGYGKDDFTFDSIEYKIIKPGDTGHKEIYTSGGRATLRRDLLHDNTVVYSIGASYFSHTTSYRTKIDSSQFENHMTIVPIGNSNNYRFNYDFYNQINLGSNPIVEMWYYEPIISVRNKENEIVEIHHKW